MPTYYVDTTIGKDTNAGTSPATAWRTVTKVNAAPLATGDVVLFKRGQRFLGTGIVAKANGVRYGAYGTGPKPVLDGGSGVGIGYHNNNDAVRYANITVEDLVFDRFEYGVRDGGANARGYRLEARRTKRNCFEFRRAGNVGSIYEDCIADGNNAPVGTQNTHGFRFTLGVNGFTLVRPIARNNVEDSIQFSETCGDNITVIGGHLSNPGENCVDRKTGTGYVFDGTVMDGGTRDYPTFSVANIQGGTSGKVTLRNCIIRGNVSNAVVSILENSELVIENTRIEGGVNADFGLKVNSFGGGSSKVTGKKLVIWLKGDGECCDFDGRTIVNLDHCTMYSANGRAIDCDADGQPGNSLNIKLTNSILRSGGSSFVIQFVTNCVRTGSDYCLLHRAGGVANESVIGHESDPATGVAWPSFTKTQVDSGAYYSSVAGGVFQRVLTANPLFVSESAGNFALQSASPARNAAGDGTNLGSV